MDKWKVTRVMSKKNNLFKTKELPETIKQFGGLALLMIIVILSFAILNNIFGEGDELVAKMKIEEERIAEARKLDKLISSLPSGILVSFDGTDHFRLTDEVYEKVCKATKLIPQRAIMGAKHLFFSLSHFTNVSLILLPFIVYNS